MKHFTIFLFSLNWKADLSQVIYNMSCCLFASGINGVMTRVSSKATECFDYLNYRRFWDIIKQYIHIGIPKYILSGSCTIECDCMINEGGELLGGGMWCYMFLYIFLDMRSLGMPNFYCIISYILQVWTRFSKKVDRYNIIVVLICAFYPFIWTEIFWYQSLLP